MADDIRPAWVYCANGLYFCAQTFSGSGTMVGEIVFNTSLSGYQEIITDSSYAGQFIVFTMPEIGIVGVNDQDCESRAVFASGVIVRHYNDIASSFRAQESLKDFLDKRNILGICGVDTRALVKMIRTQGSMMIVVSSEISDRDELAKILRESPSIEQQNYIKAVSTTKHFTHKDGAFDFSSFSYSAPTTRHKVAVIDFGAKRNILNELVSVGLEAVVYPHNFCAKEIVEAFMQGEIDGVFLSNGPGDPKTLSKEVSEIKQLIEAKIPMFGICLGHQLLALAHGYETYKLKFGHHGGNHPVKNLTNDSVEITSQNHNYCVPESIEQIAVVTHRNLFDNTIEGVAYKNAPIFSVQHHPEASPGPRESRNIFEQFAKLVDEQRNSAQSSASR